MPRTRPATERPVDDLPPSYSASQALAAHTPARLAHMSVVPAPSLGLLPTYEESINMDSLPSYERALPLATATVLDVEAKKEAFVQHISSMNPPLTNQDLSCMLSLPLNSTVGHFFASNTYLSSEMSFIDYPSLISTDDVERYTDYAYTIIKGAYDYYRTHARHLFKGPEGEIYTLKRIQGYFANDEHFTSYTDGSIGKMFCQDVRLGIRERFQRQIQELIDRRLAFERACEAAQNRVTAARVFYHA